MVLFFHQCFYLLCFSKGSIFIFLIGRDLNLIDKHVWRKTLFAYSFVLHAGYKLYDPKIWNVIVTLFYLCQEYEWDLYTYIVGLFIIYL